MDNLEYDFADLVDIPALNNILNNLYQTTGIPSAIIDLKGKILTGAGWQRFCLDFHRKNPESEKICIKSDTHISDEIAAGKPYVIYKCPHGLVDSCCPVTIDGHHIANVFTGQMLHTSLDDKAINWFRNQAQLYGFNEADYLDALSEVPVFSIEKHKNILDLLSQLAEQIAMMGLTNLRTREQARIAQQSESRFRLLLDQISNVAAQGYISDGTIQYWNKACETIYGYAAEEAIGKNFMDLIIPPPMRNFVRTAIAEGAQTGVMPPAEELKLMRKNGSLVDVFSSHAIVQRPEHEPILFCLDIDITERKRVEEKLNFLGHVSKQVLSAMITTNKNFEINWANAAFEKLYGYTQEEVLGKKPDFLNIEPFAEEIQNTIYQTVSSGKTWRGESLNKRKDGSAFPCEMEISSLVDKTGEIFSYCSQLKDITDRKQAEDALKTSEEKYRLLINNQTDLVVKVDTEGKFLFASPSYCEMFGKSMEDLLGVNFMPLVHEEDREPTLKAMESLYHEPYTAYVEQRAMTKDGWKWLSWMDTSVLDEEENVIAIIGVGRDITNRKQAEEEKEKLEDQLRQSHKMEAIGTMAGGIAHDFNNILAAILGYADMAKDDIPDSSPAKQKIEQVLTAGNRAKELVRHILTFSSMSVPVEVYDTIELSRTVKEALKFQRSIIPTTISILSDIDENCGHIKGDPTQIHQVLMNFCSNASHAMEEIGGILEIGLHKVELSSDDLKTEPDLCAGTYIQLSASDTGTGLTPDLMEKVFDPYFTTKEVGKGSGMGLAVVQGIVKNHEGFVKVDSKLGKGSTFKAFFPKIKGNAIVKTTSEADAIPTGIERILFVDDEEMLADIGKTILERLGYSVTAMTDSTAALNLFRSDSSQFDLVITDQTMPNTPGTELAKQLLQMRPEIPIILCTGHSSTIDEVKAQEIGIREYVMKPVNQAIIAKLIRKVLDNNQA
ncbi:MAG: PAS domain S-box protein [Proteobacteria bacterium]|nr:PAS domain S-box protein [Pseudomonadota bacterium]